MAVVTRASTTVSVGQVMGKAWRLLRAMPLLCVVCLGIIVVTLTLSIVAPLLPLPNPIAGDLIQRLQPPTFGLHSGPFLGTDRLGRDELSRVIFGARLSLAAAFLGIAITATVGVSVGVIAGMAGGWIDWLLMRVVDLSLAIPAVLFAILLAALRGPSFWNVMIVVVFGLWPQYARVARGDVLRVKGEEYVALARTANCPTWRLVLRHIVPNIAPPLMVIATFHMGLIIMVEAALSYLGVGVPLPTPSWGNMVSDGQAYISVAWWLTVIPGVAITANVLSWNILGDWLRDLWDPKAMVQT